MIQSQNESSERSLLESKYIKSISKNIILSYSGEVVLINKNLITKDIILNSLNNDGDSALMIAVKKGNLAIIKKLLELGASSKILTPDGESALTLAKTSGNVEVLNLLK